MERDDIRLLPYPKPSFGEFSILWTAYSCGVTLVLCVLYKVEDIADTFCSTLTSRVQADCVKAVSTSGGNWYGKSRKLRAGGHLLAILYRICYESWYGPFVQWEPSVKAG